jgi:TRAP-type C4-dicarboxylate transport system permease small subunit
VQTTTTQQERSWGLRRPRWLSVGLRGLELVELTVGAIFILAIVGLVMLQVLARVTPIDNQVWTGELARFSLVWLSFGLAGYLLGRDEHIALDVVDHVLPSLGQRIVKAFSLVVVAATAVMFGYEGLDLFSSGSPIKSPATGIPLAWIYFIPMVGMALTVLRALLEIVFPSSHHGQIRVAGEVITDDTLAADGDALTHAALDEKPSTDDDKETVR